MTSNPVQFFKVVKRFVQSNVYKCTHREVKVSACNEGLCLCVCVVFSFSWKTKKQRRHSNPKDFNAKKQISMKFFFSCMHKQNPLLLFLFLFSLSLSLCLYICVVSVFLMRCHEPKREREGCFNPVLHFCI